MSIERSLELDVIKKQIAENCAFSLGIKRIEELHPVFDKLVIERNRERIKEALFITTMYGPMPFDGATDITTMLVEASKGRLLTAYDLLNEIKMIRVVRNIQLYEREIKEKHPAIDDLVASLAYHKKTEDKLTSCINEYGEVMDNASPVLKDTRRALKEIDGRINEAVARFMANNATSIVDGITAVRNGRTVVLVKASDKNTFGGIQYGDSASGLASYIEPQALVGLNNRKASLIALESEEVDRILYECSQEVKKVADEELANLETVAILDALFAKANWGLKKEACVASLSNEKDLYLQHARHPLIDPKKVVSNTYSLKEPQHMLLITGPNTGGKTVSMKIIGLFVIMTYCGIPITASKATIPFYDQVFVDIGDDQSVVSSLSSFSAHVEKLARVMKEATDKSLCLLDEIGSGTDPQEGESLAIAILNELRKRQTMTIATTHYSRLKAYGKRHDDILVASVQFDMDKLAPTYRYIEGLTGQSNALEVAYRYGLPKPIIQYARFLKKQAKSQEDHLIDRLEQQLGETNLKNEQLEMRLEEVKKEEERLAKERAQLEHDKDVYKEKADKKAKKYLEEVQEEADEILANMRKMQETKKYHEVLEERQKLNRKETKKVKEVKEVVKKDYAVGDVVELRANNAIAEVVEVRKKDITIDLNGMKMHVKANQIRPSLKVIPKKKVQPTNTVVQGASIFSSCPTEVNLIGMHVDEALEAMEDYFSDTKVHGLKQFRIIHGDGSGALRKAVHARLRTKKDIDSFRLGMPQEGGTGATVVKMK